MKPDPKGPGRPSQKGKKIAPWWNERSAKDVVALAVRRFLHYRKMGSPDANAPDRFIFPDAILKILELKVAKVYYEHDAFLHILEDSIGVKIEEFGRLLEEHGVKRDVLSNTPSIDGIDVLKLNAGRLAPVFVHSPTYLLERPGDEYRIGETGDEYLVIGSQYYWWIVTAISALIRGRQGSDLQISDHCSQTLRKIFANKSQNDFDMDYAYRVMLLRELIGRVHKIIEKNDIDRMKQKHKKIDDDQMTQFHDCLNSYGIFEGISDECLKRTAFRGTGDGEKIAIIQIGIMDREFERLSGNDPRPIGAKIRDIEGKIYKAGKSRIDRVKKHNGWMIDMLQAITRSISMRLCDWRRN